MAVDSSQIKNGSMFVRRGDRRRIRSEEVLNSLSDASTASCAPTRQLVSKARATVYGPGRSVRGGSEAECGRARATDRAQRMEILQRPAQSGSVSGRRLVGGASAARDSAGRLRDRDGR